MSNVDSELGLTSQSRARLAAEHLYIVRSSVSCSASRLETDQSPHTMNTPSRERNMKIRVVSCAIAFVICLSALNGRLLAADHNHDQPHYKIFELRTLGGTVAGGNSINELGWASGFSYIAGNQTQHAALWAYGLTVDLGTLGGPNSGVEWLVHNNFGK